MLIENRAFLDITQSKFQYNTNKSESNYIYYNYSKRQESKCLISDWLRHRIWPWFISSSEPRLNINNDGQYCIRNTRICYYNQLNSINHKALPGHILPFNNMFLVHETSKGLQPPYAHPFHHSFIFHSITVILECETTQCITASGVQSRPGPLPTLINNYWTCQQQSTLIKMCACWQEYKPYQTVYVCVCEGGCWREPLFAVIS